MQQLTPELQACIDECLKCHSTCLSTAMTHCLEAGGEHVSPPHFRLMMDCAAMCQTSADFMARMSTWHSKACALCADICAACAADCERIGDMAECVAACRACEASCRKMAA